MQIQNFTMNASTFESDLQRFDVLKSQYERTSGNRISNDLLQALIFTKTQCLPELHAHLRLRANELTDYGVLKSTIEQYLASRHITEQMNTVPTAGPTPMDIGALKGYKGKGKGMNYWRKGKGRGKMPSYNGNWLGYNNGGYNNASGMTMNPPIHYPRINNKGKGKGQGQWMMRGKGKGQWIMRRKGKGKGMNKGKGKGYVKGMMTNAYGRKDQRTRMSQLRCNRSLAKGLPTDAGECDER